MANIINELNTLDQKLDAARTKLAANLTAKGVPSDQFDTLDIMANKVAEISQSGGGTPVLQELNVTENGTYSPNEGVDGYNKVTVNVAQSGGGNYLISPEDLAKEYTNPTLPWQSDSSSNYTLLKPTQPCLTEISYLTHHYDSNNYSEVANVDSNGNQIYTKWAGEMPEFNDYIARGYVLRHYGTEIKDYGYVNNIRQFQVTTKDGNTEYINVCSDSFDINSKDSSYQESFSNPVDGTTFRYFYPMVESNGYYKSYFLGSDTLNVNVIGANLILQDSEYNQYRVTEEDENTLIFHSRNDYNSIRGEYFNFFFNDKQYKNLKCIAGEKYVFKKGVKVIDNTTLTDTFRDNPYSEIFEECDIEKVDFSNIKGSENITTMYSWFYNCKKLKTVTFGENWNTPNLTRLDDCFYGCEKLTQINNLDKINISAVTSLASCFNGCSSLTDLSSIANWNTSAVTNLDGCFYDCSSLTKIPPIILNNVTNTSSLFNSCGSLSKIILQGDPSKITDMSNMFGFRPSSGNLKPNGTLIYDHNFDYSKIIEELHRANPTWTAKPDYEAQECTSLSITADDVVGNSTTTTIHYTAVTNGINILTGEHLSGVTVTGDVISEPFGMNPSYDTSRQVTVTFNYLGCSATTTITQSAKVHPSASVDLMSNWELATSETIPNPDPQVYEGVYQSVHKGQGEVKDKMTITFVAMPNFELYIRSYAESEYDYVFAGKLDQAEPAEGDNQASTKGNQQAGTALENYTKVEYPNDGGQHTITIIYRKDSSGESGDDRGYVFFKKPQE